MQNVATGIEHHDIAQGCERWITEFGEAARVTLESLPIEIYITTPCDPKDFAATACPKAPNVCSDVVSLA